jgi:hypothetical protein
MTVVRGKLADKKAANMQQKSGKFAKKFAAIVTIIVAATIAAEFAIIGATILNYIQIWSKLSS